MRMKWARIFYIAFGLLVLFILYKWKENYRSLSSVVQTFDRKEASKRMEGKLKQISSTCYRYNIHPGSNSGAYLLKPHPPAPQYSVFYFHKEKHLAYCPIYKAASTSMLHWLLKMQGVSAEDIRGSGKQISEVSRRFYPSLDYPEADSLLKLSTTKFMVVRHPFERLLSAYRDKLSNSTVGREHGTLHFYDKYGKKIVKKYRAPQSTLSQIEPTFEEFVRYLVDTDLSLYADDHWIPYYLFCTPCLVNYDVIIHFESMQEDVQLLLDRLGDHSGPEWKHRSSGSKSGSHLMKSFYGQVSRSTLKKLYDKYRLDFELFDYLPDDYLAVSRPDDTS